MAITRYKVFGYGDTVNYKKHDIFVNPSIPRYYYSTQNNVGEKVDAFYQYNITSFARENDIITLFYTKTGNGPNFTQGSLFIATGQADGYAYYTGMAIEGTANYVKYINAGPDLVSNTPAGVIKTVINPCWTTGFYFLPSYSTNVENEIKTITAQFGDGYSQRQRDGINSVKSTYNFSFENRSEKETKAILNFVEDKAGVEPFSILMNSTSISNDPSQKFVATNPKVTFSNYDSNTISVTLTQVFDM